MADGMKGDVGSMMAPFAALLADVRVEDGLRGEMRAACRRDEAVCVSGLMPLAMLDEGMAGRVKDVAEGLVRALRAKARRGGVEDLLQEYSLSSQEGVALMCLAEALLRIPDGGTRDALIRDKIGKGDWRGHLGHSSSLFVNAATWGLMVTGKFVGLADAEGVLARVVGRGGEGVVRMGVQVAMRLMGEQFVLGQSIEEALDRARKFEGMGFCYSYDMLGEAAVTAGDALRYFGDYERAIHAIGKAAGGRGIFEGPGISVKLSALHPRYCRAQRGRVMGELLPRLGALAVLARGYGIGLNIDAEEADRLELSMDLLEALCFDERLNGWDGIGFVVQAYQKRAPFVIDWLVDLAGRCGHRIMVRLVKGAYWDSEIKRAQVEGFADFPVFTRKVHTDVSYLACARKMLAAGRRIFPQFATHNAQSVASVYEMAGNGFELGRYEFQCLHGMGEPLYQEVVGVGKLGRPCRIYAPVGTHKTLLAYLVRRLLENGANSSFVNRIADPSVGVGELVAAPADVVLGMAAIGAPHEKIAAPLAMFGNERRNSAGVDLASEAALGALAGELVKGVETGWLSQPLLGDSEREGMARAVLNPAHLGDEVGRVVEAGVALVDEACRMAVGAAARWGLAPAGERSGILRRGGEILEKRMGEFVGLLVREAGKTMAAAVGEAREAVDFLRYYAARGDELPAGDGLGVVVAISPWNFPLAIFLGQIAAALSAGNAVVAKPAEETPLVAAAAVRILHEAGVPLDVLQMLPGDGALGAALVKNARVEGVMFTGSNAVARAIQRQLSGRVDSRGMPVMLIAETGGQNAMIVDSSALLEQAVGDVLASAFDSAGQRCSAVRLVLVQEDIAARFMAMLLGAMAELRVGRPDLLQSDVGPVISLKARERVVSHVERMKARGFAVHQSVLDEGLDGYFVSPCAIEIPGVDVLGEEVFGPVLHVARFRRAALDLSVEAINKLGYGLSFGIHSRVDETIGRVVALIRAGNVYVNRTIIGAVVGAQPFGGDGLSGTGPKAGGPLYLRRLRRDFWGESPAPPLLFGPAPAVFERFCAWVEREGLQAVEVRKYGAVAPVTSEAPLPGPVGEENVYRLVARGAVLCVAETVAGLLGQIAAALCSGNVAVLRCGEALPVFPEDLGMSVVVEQGSEPIDAALFEGDDAGLRALLEEMAAREGAVVTVFALPRFVEGALYPVAFLMAERVVSTNMAAAGGNASLMAMV